MIILRRAFALVTTPIFYPNADPHIGHAFTMILANAVALVLKNNAGPHLLTTGVDEQGTKIQRRAAELGVSPIQLCDKVSARFKALA
jgi:methionyl-tRNA synthetase